MPRAKGPQKLPQILAREEVARLIEQTPNLKHRALLMTTYGGGAAAVRSLSPEGERHRQRSA